jgi:hypothetical protein
MALMVLSIVNSLIILFYECNSDLLGFFFLIITENLNQPLNLIKKMRGIKWCRLKKVCVVLKDSGVALYNVHVQTLLKFDNDNQLNIVSPILNMFNQVVKFLHENSIQFSFEGH